MAEALVVQFLLNNLNLLLNEADLQSNVKDNVANLVRDLTMLKAFVADAAKIPDSSEVVKEMVNTIRVQTYEAEDAIDLYVVQEAIQKSRSAVKKMIKGVDHVVKIHSVAVEVEKVRANAKSIQDNKLYGFEALKRVNADGKTPKEKIPPAVEEENVVGFDDEAKTVIDRLIRGTQDLQVISILGMPGLGKTTLAHKIYNDPEVAHVFSTRGWSYVSQTYKRKEVLLDILSGVVAQVTPAMRSMTDVELVREVKKSLSWRYLVVVDDVWAEEDWETLRVAFPDNKNGSRILLTSRHKEPALAANPDPGSPPHDLKFLTPDESWELLRKKVFGRTGTCPSHLAPTGETIARDCKGLPLAIVVVAGMLRGKAEQTWKNVALDVNRYIVTDPKQMMEVLALSYNKLPHHMKPCFLYFGVFPEDFEIPVWKLIRLWIAEGFVENFGDIRLEDRAVEILDELVGRNLVMTSKRSLMGQIKTCRVHDMLRDLCVMKARDENFYREIKMAEVWTGDFRRLCIHSRIMEYIASKPSGKHVRSFLCFNSSEDNKELPREHVAYLPQGFELLRVFDVQPISFSIFPTKLIQLVLIRHVAISGKFKILPAAVSNLRNLQTLIVETTERTIDIQADIWKMSHLRHVHTTGASKLSGPLAKTTIPLLGKKREGPSVGSNHLQTLTCITPESCNQNVLSRIPNVRKLGIRGKLSLLVAEGKGGSESLNLSRLEKLEKLKLVNDVCPLPPSEGKLPALPKSYGFPPYLKKLTLQDTYLDWSSMSVLEMLPKLEVLKLRDFAFEGKEWNISGEGFAELRVLHIGKTDLKDWVASDFHFPKIQRLAIKECQSLKAIPPALGEVSTLLMIELHHASPSAVASAKEIKRKSDKGLQVDIYPPEIKTAP